jgi:hypothetical protein
MASVKPVAEFVFEPVKVSNVVGANASGKLHVNGNLRTTGAFQEESDFVSAVFSLTWLSFASRASA